MTQSEEVVVRSEALILNQLHVVSHVFFSVGVKGEEGGGNQQLI